MVLGPGSFAGGFERVELLVLGGGAGRDAVYLTVQLARFLIQFSSLNPGLIVLNACAKTAI